MHMFIMFIDLNIQYVTYIEYILILRFPWGQGWPRMPSAGKTHNACLSDPFRCGPQVNATICHDSWGGATGWDWGIKPPFEHRNARVKLPTLTQAVSQHQWISSSGWWDQGHPFAPFAWTFGMGSRWSCKWCLAVMEDLMAFAGFLWINSMLEDKGTRSLGGGFQDVLVSPLLGEDVQFDQHVFRWVETTH